MNLFFDILKETLFFFNEISAYLLFGFFVAAIMHVIFPETIIRKHLGNNSFGSVIKSTLFGIPLPLCSCGALPVAVSLKNSGASKGASISFLIATPQIGADSFLMTYSLLGWIFSLFRILASLITAIFAGIMVNITAKNEEPQISAFPVDNTGPDTFKTRLGSFFFYLEYELLGSLANTLIIGIIAAGIIAAVIPDYFFEQYLNYPFLSLLIMLVIGIPMYVCASASTPIAASLIMKGMAPGAALVFLLTGPATNAVTISTIIRTLGKKTALIYILCISVVSLVLGQTLNIVSSNYGLSQIIMTHQHEILPAWLKISGSVLLSLMVLWYYFDTKILTNLKRTKNMEHNKIRFNVEGMECMHCSGSVKKAVMAVSGTSDITVNLDGKYVEFQINDPANIENVKSAISSAGYQLSYCKH